MYRTVLKLLSAAASLLLCCATSRGQERPLVGLYQSPHGVGVTAFFPTPDASEMDILTLRTDFYGLLAGRTNEVGGCISYTHDYSLLRAEGPDFRLQLHAGAGGLAGFGHDFEKGFFSATERSLVHNRGWIIAPQGNFGMRVDFRRHLSLDLSFAVAPGVLLRTDKATGTLLVSFYKNGTYHAYYPQINLMYRF